MSRKLVNTIFQRFHAFISHAAPTQTALSALSSNLAAAKGDDLTPRCTRQGRGPVIKTLGITPAEAPGDGAAGVQPEHRGVHSGARGRTTTPLVYSPDGIALSRGLPWLSRAT
jgi:hypothetical protein